MTKLRIKKAIARKMKKAKKTVIGALVGITLATTLPVAATASQTTGFTILTTNGAGYFNGSVFHEIDTGTWQLGEFNNDGKTDLIRYVNGAFDIYLSDGAGGFSWSMEQHHAIDSGVWKVGDFDGDGNDDIIRYVEGRYLDIFFTDGAGRIRSGERNEMDAGVWQLGEFNNDGKTDLIRYVNGAFDIYLSDGHGHFSWSMAQHHGIDSGNWKVGDFDGDGNDDIIRYVEGRYLDIFFTDGAGRLRHPGVRNELDAGVWQLGEFNNDGKTDLIRYVNGAFDIYLSDGHGHFSWSMAQHHAIDSGPKWAVGDFDGDGNADFVRYVEGRYLDIFFTDGAGRIRSGERNDMTGENWQLGDFNGDGASDVILAKGLTPLQQEQLSLLNAYFERIGLLAKEPSLKPSAPNAANGYFRKAIIEDSIIYQLRMALRDKKYEVPGTDRTQSLFIALDEIWDAFVENPDHYDNWTRSSDIVADHLRESEGQLWQLAGAVFRQYPWGAGFCAALNNVGEIEHFVAAHMPDAAKLCQPVDTSDITDALADVSEFCQDSEAYGVKCPSVVQTASEKLNTQALPVVVAAVELVDSLANSPLASDGKHPSGHIAKGVRFAANDTLTRIQAGEFGSGTGYQGQVADRFRAICEQLQKLPTDGHEPWLRADWQVQFGAIMGTGKSLLDSMMGEGF